MKKTVIFIAICTMSLSFSGCSKEKPINEPALQESISSTTVVPEKEAVTEKTTYVLDERQSLNTDYRIKHEASEIAHLESLFDTLNEIS